MTTKQTEVAIIGGGLSGLACALRLHQAGATCVVLEAADRVGGRIGVTVDDSGQTIGDLGPTWVWPPAQQTVSRWLDELDVQPLPQFEEGDAVVERSREEQPKRMPLPGQWGMTRLVGGPWSLIAEIEKRLPPECIKTATPVSEIQRRGNAFDLTSVDGTTASASQVVIAAPLRIAAQQIDFNGLLDEPTLELMGAAPTWMAAQAKVVIGYDRAFWREAGLSGRIASQVRPMVEVHDHCGPDAVPAALFGFIGVAPQVRLEHQQELRAAIIEQLVHCFGEAAAEPTHLHIEDWAQNSFICVEEDRLGPGSHPSTLHESLRTGFADNAIRFAGAETATQSPGLIDGALEAAERAAQQVLQQLR